MTTANNKGEKKMYEYDTEQTIIIDTEQMTWDKIPQDIRDWLCDDADFIEWVENELEGGL